MIGERGGGGCVRGVAIKVEMMGKKLLIVAMLAGTVAVFAWNHGPPKRSNAGVGGGSVYRLYGIDGVSGDLVRYDFDDEELSTVGTVTSGGTVLTGIQGAAYIPGHTNIIGFWTDPSDSQSKVVYINTNSAAASIVGDPLGAGTITGATAVQPDGGGHHQIYAVQSGNGVDFDIDDGEVTPSESYAVRVTALGAAITYGGQYDEPVIARITVDGQVFEPFGPWGLPLNADVNDDENPRHVVLPGTFDADTDISVSGRNWIKKLLQNGDRNSEWQIRREVHSEIDTNRVIILRNGDPVPNYVGFLNQASIVDFVIDYVDTVSNTMVLSETQAIYLFELGSSLSSSAADFQDLVVLVTLAKDPADLSGDFDSPASEVSGSISVNPNNSPQNEFTLVTNDGAVITRDDLHQNTNVNGDGVFFSGGAQKVYFKPKGNGSQNSLMVDGSAYTFQNSDAYTITGLYMPVIVYNDHIHTNGKAMGKWHVRFYDGYGTVVQGEVSVPAGPTDEAGSAANLIRVDHKTGAVEEIMALGSAYESLAGLTETTFLGAAGGDLYLINTLTQTEVVVGSLPQLSVTSLDHAGASLMGYSTANQSVFEVSEVTGALVGSATGIGVADLGSVIFKEVVGEGFVGYD